MNTSIFNEEFTGYLGVVVTPKRLVSGWRLAFTQSSVALPLSHEPLHCRSLDRSLLLIKFFSRLSTSYLLSVQELLPGWHSELYSDQTVHWWQLRCPKGRRWATLTMMYHTVCKLLSPSFSSPSFKNLPRFMHLLGPLVGFQRVTCQLCRQRCTYTSGYCCFCLNAC